MQHCETPVPTANNDNFFEKIVIGIMTATGSFVVLTVGISAIMRYLLHKDIYGIEELVTVAAFWMYFSGAVYAAKSRQHISAEMIGVLTRNKTTLYAAAVLKHSITLALCAVYTWWGWEFFHWGVTEGGKTNLWQFPVYVGQSSVFIGLVCMLGYFVRDLILLARMSVEDFAQRGLPS